MLTNEILSSIDNIDDCVMEAEMNVISAMINEYDKAIMIMENYNGNDYSSFDIFQEGFKDEVNKPVRGVKGENIIKRILMAIPRLIALLVKKVKKFFNKEKSERIVKNLETIKRVKVKDLNKLKIRRNKKTRTNNTSTNPVETVTDNDQEEVDLDKGSDSLEINNMVEDLVEKKVINTNLKVDVIAKYLDDCLNVQPGLFDVFREYVTMSDEEQNIVNNINEIIKKLDEYWSRCQNKPCMQHKSESDVRTYITSPNKQEYDIDDIWEFISGVDFKLHTLSSLDTNELKQNLADLNNRLTDDIEFQRKYITKEMSFINAHIHYENLKIKIIKQLLIVVPIVAKIVDEEFDKWDEATKRAVGLLNEED